MGLSFWTRKNLEVRRVHTGGLRGRPGAERDVNGSFCAQVKERRILALDCERTGASGGASQDLRLMKDKVVDVPTDVRGMRDCERADREVVPAGSLWCIGVGEEKGLYFQCGGIKEVCPG